MGKTLPLLLLAGSLVAPGCAPRPVIENHKEFYGKFNPTDVNQRDSTYKSQVLTVMGKEYFLHRTIDGRVGMFKLAEATRIVDEPRASSRSKAAVRLVSGERLTKDGELGVYVLEREKGYKDHAKDPFLDGVILRTKGERAKVARINNPENNADLAVRKSTEQDCQYNLPTINLPGLNECYVVSAGTPFCGPGMYSFHIIPVKGSKLIIDKNGKMTIENENQVWRPMFREYSTLKELKAKADAAAAKRIAEEAAKAKKLANEAAEKKAEAEKKAREILPSSIGPRQK